MLVQTGLPASLPGCIRPQAGWQAGFALCEASFDKTQNVVRDAIQWVKTKKLFYTVLF